ncbi:MAG: hypothetical protein ACJ0DK_01310 [Planctomycetota bacterium]
MTSPLCKGTGRFGQLSFGSLKPVLQLSGPFAQRRFDLRRSFSILIEGSLDRLPRSLKSSLLPPARNPGTPLLLHLSGRLLSLFSGFLKSGSRLLKVLQNLLGSLIPGLGIRLRFSTKCTDSLGDRSGFTCLLTSLSGLS